MRRIVLVVLLLAGILTVAASGTASAQDGAPSPSPSETEAPSDGGVCDGLPWPISGTCDAVTGVVGTGADLVVETGAKAALSAVVGFVVEGSGWLLGQLASVIDATTRPDVTAGWFRGAYGDMAAVALVGLLPFVLLAIIQGLIRQDPGLLVRSTLVYVPVAAIATGGAVVVVDMLVTITDTMSGWMGRSMGEDLAEFASGLGTAVTALAIPTGGGAAGLAALLGAGVVAFASFVIWLELLLRQAAIYVAVLFLPLGFMAMVWPATAHWLRRLVQGLVAIVLSKFVIVSVMALAAAALNANVAGDGFGVVVAGGALLSLAALAPYVLLKMIPVFEAGMTGQFEGTFRRPTAAVAAPSTARGGQIAQMIRQRVGPGSDTGATSWGGTSEVAGGGPSGGDGMQVAKTAANGAGPGSSATAASGAAGSGGGAAAGAGAAGGVAAAGAGVAAVGAGVARKAVGKASDTASDTAGIADGGDVGSSNGRPVPPRPMTASSSPPVEPDPGPPAVRPIQDGGEATG